MTPHKPVRRARGTVSLASIVAVGLAGVSACSSDENQSVAAVSSNEVGATSTASDSSAAPAVASPDQVGGEGTTPPTTPATEPRRFSVSISEPAAIDPALNQEIEGAQVVRQLFQPLIELSPAMELVAGAATDWNVAADGVTWTFELARGATFTDGTPVDADDFVFAFARSADPDLASPVAYQGLPIVGWAEVMDGEASGAIGDVPVAGVRAVDGDTLEIVTDGPFALLPHLMTFPSFAPVPSEMAGDPEAEAAFGDQPIGNGRYLLVEPWQHNTSITLEKNPTYQGTPGRADRIEFRIYSDTATAFRDVQAGTLDLARLLPSDVLDEARADFGDRYVETAVASLQYIGFPTARPPYDNVDLRRAMSMVIDREALTKGVLQGSSTPADGFVPPGVPGAVNDGCDYCTYDPDRARELLEAAGGPPSDPVVLYDISDDGSAAIDYLVTVWLDELGIDTEVRSFEFAQFLDETATGVAEGPFELGWVWDYPSPHSILSPLFESSSGANNLDWADDEFDALMEDVREAPSDDVAIPALERAQALVADQLPLIPIGFAIDAGVMSKRITGAFGDTGAIWRLELVDVVA